MSGGTQLHEEDGSDKITFRLSTHLKKRYKENVDNMSADLEEYVRRRVEEPADRDEMEPWEEPHERELAAAYRTLCRSRTETGTVRGKRAKKALAQAISGVDQDDAFRVLRRLEKRGYVHLQNEAPPSERLCVYVRPFSKRGRLS